MGNPFSNEHHVMKSDVWLTPPHILKALGDFDLDPCSPLERPWDTAAKHYTIEDDGLTSPWHGRVWMNPPYGYEMGKWMEKLAAHGNGIALVFARTETKAFFDHVWPKADALLFLKGRLKFCNTKGEPQDNAGSPSVLIAFGKENVDALLSSGLDGKLVYL